MLPVFSDGDETLATKLASKWNPDRQHQSKVADILDDVRKKGDVALMKASAAYDNFAVSDIHQLLFDKAQIQAWKSKISKQQFQLLTDIYQRLVAYHQHQVEQGFTYQDSYSNHLGQRVSPISRAGLYVPGGSASYPSSVLMNAVPANVAGVQSITMCMPTPNGVVNPLTMAAAALCDIDQVACIGGAQAIGAMAFGTQSIAKVDKIVGPGNAWVAEAKRQVYGLVGLDMLAGPSEVVIISDGSASPHWVLTDMCAQAEHDADARAILLTTSADEIDNIQRLCHDHAASWPRKEIIMESFRRHGVMVLCQNLDSCIELANTIAPEHLQIMTTNAASLAERIHNAGAIFIGKYSCEGFGDYCAGPNHVLPTAGTARFASALGVYDFYKRTSIIQCSAQGAQFFAKLAEPLALAEGLSAHGASARLRDSKNICVDILGTSD